MKVYILKEDVKYIKGDLSKYFGKGLTGKKIAKMIDADMEVVYKKGDRFLLSKVCFENNIDDNKRFLYPANYDVANYKVSFLGMRMDETIEQLVSCWCHTLTMMNILLKTAKFKVIEDASIVVSPEEQLFMQRIEAAIKIQKNRIENANAVLKELNTVKAQFTIK